MPTISPIAILSATLSGLLGGSTYQVYMLKSEVCFCNRSELVFSHVKVKFFYFRCESKANHSDSLNYNGPWFTINTETWVLPGNSY